MDNTVIGLDIAKNIFHIFQINPDGTFKKKKLTRKKLLNHFANKEACLIGMEACGSSHYWARELTKLGHNVKIMPPQYVKPYVKTNKNDMNDAEAIAEAVTRSNMRFVPIKAIEQQDVLSIHRIRERLVKQRTALSCEIRGLLLEYGIAMPKGRKGLEKKLQLVLMEDKEKITYMAKEFFSDLYEELIQINKKIEKYEKKIEQISINDQNAKRLLTIPGIGPITATALAAAIGNASEFENGRHLSAWLGLVPRQNSTGGNSRLMGISKRGDKYIRKLLIHGARSAKSKFKRENDALKDSNEKGLAEEKLRDWIINLSSRCNDNKATVALANKMARIACAVLQNDNVYIKNYSYT